MKISRVIEFLENVKATEGDLELSAVTGNWAPEPKPVTGFWVRTIPSTGERVIICSLGEAEMPVGGQEIARG